MKLIVTSRSIGNIVKALQSAPKTEAPAKVDSVWPETIHQEHSSAATSINAAKLPSSFKTIDKMGGWKSGTVNADIGGGRFDNHTQALAEKGVTNHIFDPFNRSKEHNDHAVSQIAGGKAHTVTVNNVLNVIKEPENRDRVIRQAANAVHPQGTAHFLVYEGNKSGQGAETKAGYQMNAPAHHYIDHISQHFNDVQRKGNLILARGPKAQNQLEKSFNGETLLDLWQGFGGEVVKAMDSKDAPAKTTKYSWASTQINVPEALAARLIEWNYQNIPEEDLACDGRESEPHITVKYGLAPKDGQNESQMAEQLRELLSKRPAVTGTLGALGVFRTNPDFDVLMVEVHSPALHRLNSVIRDWANTHAQCNDTFPTYKPHLTLAYLKKGKADALEGSGAFEGTRFEVGDVLLSDRDGQQHSLPIVGGAAPLDEAILSSMAKAIDEAMGKAYGYGETQPLSFGEACQRQAAKRAYECLEAGDSNLEHVAQATHVGWGEIALSFDDPLYELEPEKKEHRRALATTPYEELSDEEKEKDRVAARAAIAAYQGKSVDIETDKITPLVAPPTGVNPKEWAMGLQEEQEHSDVTGGDARLTAKIAHAHLKEDPRYYSKLKRAGLMGKADEISKAMPVGVRLVVSAAGLSKAMGPVSTNPHVHLRYTAHGAHRWTRDHEDRAEKQRLFDQAVKTYDELRRHWTNIYVDPDESHKMPPQYNSVLLRAYKRAYRRLDALEQSKLPSPYHWEVVGDGERAMTKSLAGNPVPNIKGNVHYEAGTGSSGGQKHRVTGAAHHDDTPQSAPAPVTPPVSDWILHPREETTFKAPDGKTRPAIKPPTDVVWRGTGGGAISRGRTFTAEGQHFAADKRFAQNFAEYGDPVSYGMSPDTRLYDFNWVRGGHLEDHPHNVLSHEEFIHPDMPKILTEKLKAQGYHGLINDQPRGGTEYVMWHPQKLTPRHPSDSEGWYEDYDAMPGYAIQWMGDEDPDQARWAITDSFEDGDFNRPTDRYALFDSNKEESHIPVGEFDTIEEAKHAAHRLIDEENAAQNSKPPVIKSFAELREWLTKAQLGLFEAPEASVAHSTALNRAGTYHYEQGAGKSGGKKHRAGGKRAPHRSDTASGDLFGAPESDSGVDKLHHYGLTIRPAGFATVPEGYKAIGKHFHYPMGTVSYDHPLTEKQIKDYTLHPIPESAHRATGYEKGQRVKINVGSSVEGPHVHGEIVEPDSRRPRVKIHQDAGEMQTPPDMRAGMTAAVHPNWFQFEDEESAPPKTADEVETPLTDSQKTHRDLAQRENDWQKVPDSERAPVHHVEQVKRDPYGEEHTYKVHFHDGTAADAWAKDENEARENAQKQRWLDQRHQSAEKSPEKSPENDPASEKREKMQAAQRWIDDLRKQHDEVSGKISDHMQAGGEVGDAHWVEHSAQLKDLESRMRPLRDFLHGDTDHVVSATTKPTETKPAFSVGGLPVEDLKRPPAETVRDIGKAGPIGDGKSNFDDAEWRLHLNKHAELQKKGFVSNHAQGNADVIAAALNQHKPSHVAVHYDTSFHPHPEKSTAKFQARIAEIAAKSGMQASEPEPRTVKGHPMSGHVVHLTRKDAEGGEGNDAPPSTPQGTPQGNWRDAVDQETDPSRRSDMLRGIADASQSAAELADVADRLHHKHPEAGNIAHAVMQNPHADADTKARAGAIRDKVFPPAKSDAQPSPKPIPEELQGWAHTARKYPEAKDFAWNEISGQQSEPRSMTPNTSEVRAALAALHRKHGDEDTAFSVSDVKDAMGDKSHLAESQLEALKNDRRLQWESRADLDQVRPTMNHHWHEKDGLEAKETFADKLAKHGFKDAADFHAAVHANTPEKPQEKVPSSSALFDAPPVNDSKPEVVTRKEAGVTSPTGVPQHPSPRTKAQIEAYEAERAKPVKVEDTVEGGMFNGPAKARQSLENSLAYLSATELRRAAGEDTYQRPLRYESHAGKIVREATKDLPEHTLMENRAKVALTRHRDAVEQAFKDGLVDDATSIGIRHIKDYPDLAARHGKSLAPVSPKEPVSTPAETAPQTETPSAPLKSKRHKATRDVSFQAERKGDHVHVKGFVGGRKAADTYHFPVDTWPEHPFDQYKAVMKVYDPDSEHTSGHRHAEAITRAVQEVVGKRAPKRSTSSKPESFLAATRDYSLRPPIGTKHIAGEKTGEDSGSLFKSFAGLRDWLLKAQMGLFGEGEGIGIAEPHHYEKRGGHEHRVRGKRVADTSTGDLFGAPPLAASPPAMSEWTPEDNFVHPHGIVPSYDKDGKGTFYGGDKLTKQQKLDWHELQRQRFDEQLKDGRGEDVHVTGNRRFNQNRQDIKTRHLKVLMGQRRSHEQEIARLKESLAWNAMSPAEKDAHIKAATPPPPARLVVSMSPAPAKKAEKQNTATLTPQIKEVLRRRNHSRAHYGLPPLLPGDPSLAKFPDMHDRPVDRDEHARQVKLALKPEGLGTEGLKAWRRFYNNGFMQGTRSRGWSGKNREPRTFDASFTWQDRYQSLLHEFRFRYRRGILNQLLDDGIQHHGMGEPENYYLNRQYSTEAFEAGRKDAQADGFKPDADTLNLALRVFGKQHSLLRRNPHWQKYDASAEHPTNDTLQKRNGFWEAIRPDKDDSWMPTVLPAPVQESTAPASAPKKVVKAAPPSLQLPVSEMDALPKYHDLRYVPKEKFEEGAKQAKLIAEFIRAGFPQSKLTHKVETAIDGLVLHGIPVIPSRQHYSHDYIYDHSFGTDEQRQRFLDTLARYADTSLSLHSHVPSITTRLLGDWVKATGLSKAPSAHELVEAELRQAEADEAEDDFSDNSPSAMANDPDLQNTPKPTAQRGDTVTFSLPHSPASTRTGVVENIVPSSDEIGVRDNLVGTLHWIKPEHIKEHVSATLTKAIPAGVTLVVKNRS